MIYEKCINHHKKMITEPKLSIDMMIQIPNNNNNNNEKIIELENIGKCDDMNILFVGKNGIGKTRLAFFLLKFQPYYCMSSDTSNDIQMYKYNNIIKWKSYINKMVTFSSRNNISSASELSDSSSTSSNTTNEDSLHKILYYDNYYYLDIASLSSNEMQPYFKFIQMMNANTNINNNHNNHNNNYQKKIFIIKNVDKLSALYQKILGRELEIHFNILFWLISNKPHCISSKIKANCLYYIIKPLSKLEFGNIYIWNMQEYYKKMPIKLLINNLYNIYRNNRYNIGNTFLQIIYTLKQLLDQNQNQNQNKNNGELNIKNMICINLQQQIIENLIKKYCKLTNLNNMTNIRLIFTNLIVLNCDYDSIIIDIVNKILSYNIPISKKQIIIQLASSSSILLIKSDKAIIILEHFFMKLIYILFTNN